jgi:hypothetical protein
MLTGVKIGPANWQQVLNRITPECVEVYFRLDWQEKYPQIFTALRKKKIPFGLHFWGVLPGGIEPNLCYEPHDIASNSVKLIKETLEVAAREKATYVNVHPGYFKPKALNLDTCSFTNPGLPAIAKSDGLSTLINKSLDLNDYATKLNVMFILETLPSKEPSEWKTPEGRLTTLDFDPIPLNYYLQLAHNDLFVCHDFCHTLTHFSDLSEPEAFKKLYEFASQLAHATKLIHINTIIPPFNGTDSHNGILDIDYQQQARPTLTEVNKLLSLFKDRPDVWVIPEPQIDKMVENFQVLKQLIISLN